MLLGPFRQLVTMEGLPSTGILQDEQLTVIPQAGMLVENGLIREIGLFQEMRQHAKQITEIPFKAVGIPGFIDAHTHICYAGSRARDYALRVSGVTYQQIAAGGGGILDTVRHTRQASKELLVELLKKRAMTHLREGVTTCEVKSGYGLTIDDEVKQLEAIQQVSQEGPFDLISTCLAAHTRPPEFSNNQEYLNTIVHELFPVLRQKKLTTRIDIFVDEHAFTNEEARTYLQTAHAKGFQVVMHADQFSRGGALLAAELKALSADHLEKSNQIDAQALHDAGVIPIVLPGSCLGLGLPFPPARMLLDENLPLVIASDWNPGSAPMGNLLAQAAFLGASEHLTIAETLAAITCRAALALSLKDRGSLKVNSLADICIFECDDFREILYHQGALKPTFVYKKGVQVQTAG